MQIEAMEWIRLTESAWLIRTEGQSLDAQAVEPLAAIPGVLDVVIGYDSVAVYFDRAHLSAVDVQEQVRNILLYSSNARTASQLITIPVVYGGEDLAAVAEACDLTQDEVVALHSSVEYDVVTLGFVPGFPFLRGLPEALHVPRRATPRTVVPAGSVGIAGAQTGVYPWATPGGWHLIGHTDAIFFDAARAEPSLLRAGDRVRFVPVTATEPNGGGAR